MYKFHIVKDGTGGKIIMQSGSEYHEKYLTNTELKRLYIELKKYYEN